MKNLFENIADKGCQPGEKKCAVCGKIGKQENMVFSNKSKKAPPLVQGHGPIGMWHCTRCFKKHSI